MKKTTTTRKYSIVPSKHMYVNKEYGITFAKKMPRYYDMEAIIYNLKPEGKRFRFIARKNASYLNANGEAKHIKKIRIKKDSLTMR